MGLEIVVKDVLARGEEEAKRIKHEGKEEANAITKEAENTAHQILKVKREQTAQQIERRKHHEIVSTHLEVKRAVLNAQKELLDDVYTQAKRELTKLPESDREEMIKKLLRSHEGFARVFSNEQDEHIVRRNTDLEFGGDILCAGGILLESEDGKVIRDLTFDTMLESVREDSVKRVSEILFE